MSKTTLNKVNNVLICSLSIVYLAYLSFMRKTKLIGLLVGVYLSAYLLTNKHLSSMIVAIILALCIEIMLKSYETWGVNINIGTGRPFNILPQNLTSPTTQAPTVQCDRIGVRNTCNSADNPRCSWFENECVDNSILMHETNDDGAIELSSPLRLECSRRGQTDCVDDNNNCSWEESNERCVVLDGFVGSNVVEPFKGKSKKKRRRRRKVENF